MTSSRLLLACALACLAVAVDQQCDIVIAGGSTASLAAAITAAEADRKLIVCYTEITDWPGGQVLSAAIYSTSCYNYYPLWLISLVGADHRVIVNSTLACGPARSPYSSLTTLVLVINILYLAVGRLITFALRATDADSVQLGCLSLPGVVSSLLPFRKQFFSCGL